MSTEKLTGQARDLAKEHLRVIAEQIADIHREEDRLRNQLTLLRAEQAALNCKVWSA